MDIINELIKFFSTHTYESIFMTFLFILLIFTIYSVYFLFFRMPYVKGKKNQDFVASEVAQFSEYYKKVLKEEFDKISTAQKEVLSKTSETLLSDYKALLTAETEKTRVSMNSVFDQVKTGITAQMEDLKKDLGSDQQSIKILLETKLQEALQKVDLEFAEYKKAKMQKLDETIMDAVKRVSEQVLSKSLNINEHKQLIFSCLEEAKKEGIFDAI